VLSGALRGWPGRRLGGRLETAVVAGADAANAEAAMALRQYWNGMGAQLGPG
jgi:hypothetical protein